MNVIKKYFNNLMRSLLCLSIMVGCFSNCYADVPKHDEKNSDVYDFGYDPHKVAREDYFYSEDIGTEGALVLRNSFIGTSAWYPAKEYTILPDDEKTDKEVKDAIDKTCNKNRSLSVLRACIFNNKGTLHLAKGLEGYVRAIKLALDDLKGNKVTTLHIQVDKHDATSIRKIAEALKANTSLTELTLGCVKFDDEFVQELVEVLKTNKTLAVLNLVRVKLSVEGARALAEALNSSETLTTFRLRGMDLIAEEARSDLLWVKSIDMSNFYFG